jgi:hypothetical protein
LPRQQMPHPGQRPPSSRPAPASPRPTPPAWQPGPRTRRRPARPGTAHMGREAAFTHRGGQGPATAAAQLRAGLNRRTDRGPCHRGQAAELCKITTRSSYRKNHIQTRLHTPAVPSFTPCQAL